MATEGDFSGRATMLEDGTLVLVLRSNDPRIGVVHSTTRYAKGDPHYAEVLAHVGPIQPGETRPVRPWGR